MQTCYIAIACRLSNPNSSALNSPKRERVDDSSASSTSSLASSPSSTKYSPTILNFSYATFDGNDPTVIEICEIELTDIDELRQLESNILGKFSTRPLIVSAAEDIRQSLFPFAAAFRSEQDLATTHTLLSEIFHNFVNVEALAPTIELIAPPAEASLTDRVRFFLATTQQYANFFEQCIETVYDAYTPAVCVDTFVDSNLVVRARGLPWSVNDSDVGLFFAGLNIAPGGIALCLSQDGRRNGEALVRFSCRAHREFALQRHRKFLFNRYIEVYRASGEDFLKVAVGADLEAVRFASKKCAMIVRMRGLPFDCSEAQIRDFFSENGQDSGIIDQGILFVNRPDGRPSGDAFVLFDDEISGRRALSKHKQKIGNRYVELFRTSIAEVQQVFNRTIRSPQLSVSGVNTQKKDCIRLRGLPYEAGVQQIVDFLKDHSSNIMYQGVHMIYNNQGHPSGEAFIQMNSEAAASSAAQGMHNKYMELGRKKRYVEVFQVSIDEVNLMLNAPTTTAPSISPTTPTPIPNLIPGILPTPLLPLSANPATIHALYRVMPNGLPLMPIQQPHAMLNLAAAQNIGAFGLPATFSQVTMPMEHAYTAAAAPMHLYPDAMQLIAAQQQFDAIMPHQPSRFYPTPTEIQHLVEMPPPSANNLPLPLIHT